MDLISGLQYRSVTHFCRRKSADIISQLSKSNCYYAKIRQRQQRQKPERQRRE